MAGAEVGQAGIEVGLSALSQESRLGQLAVEVLITDPVEVRFGQLAIEVLWEVPSPTAPTAPPPSLTGFFLERVFTGG